MYFHIVHSTFRPLLVIERRWRQHQLNTSPDGNVADPPRMITRAREIASQAARDSIICIEAAGALNAAAKVSLSLISFVMLSYLLMNRTIV